MVSTALAGGLAGLGAAGERVSMKFLEEEMTKQRDATLAKYRQDEQVKGGEIARQNAQFTDDLARKDQGMIASAIEQFKTENPNATPEQIAAAGQNAALSRGRPDVGGQYRKVMNDDLTESGKIEKTVAGQIAVKGAMPGESDAEKRLKGAHATYYEDMPKKYEATQASTNARLDRQRDVDANNAVMRDRAAKRIEMKNLADSAGTELKQINERRKALQMEGGSPDATKAELASLSQRERDANATIRTARKRILDLSANETGGGGGGPSPDERRQAFLTQDPQVSDTPPEAGAKLDDQGYWKVGNKYVATDDGRPVRGDPKEGTHTAGSIGEPTPQKESGMIARRAQDSQRSSLYENLIKREPKSSNYSINTGAVRSYPWLVNLKGMTFKSEEEARAAIDKYSGK